MAHFEKYKRVALDKMLSHYKRDEASLKRDNIDPSLTRLNKEYNFDATIPLAKRVEISIEKAIEFQEQETGRKLRKDATLMVDLAITYPQDLKEADFEKFNQLVLDFNRNKFGQNNVLGGFLHNDEPKARTHFHIPILPLVNGRFNAKAIMTREMLRGYHSELQDYLAKNGVVCSILLDEKDAEKKALSRLPQDEYKQTMNAKKNIEQREKDLDKRESEINALKQSLTNELKDIPEKVENAVKTKINEFNEYINKELNNVKSIKVLDSDEIYVKVKQLDNGKLKPLDSADTLSNIIAKKKAEKEKAIEQMKTSLNSFNVKSNIDERDFDIAQRKKDKDLALS